MAADKWEYLKYGTPKADGYEECFVNRDAAFVPIDASLGAGFSVLLIHRLCLRQVVARLTASQPMSATEGPLAPA